MLYDVINYYLERGLWTFGSSFESHSSFSFNDFEDISTYILNLPFDTSSPSDDYKTRIKFFGGWKSEFSDLELDYIKAASKLSINNNSFGASFLEEFLTEGISFSSRELEPTTCTIDKEKKRILHKEGQVNPPVFEDRWIEKDSGIGSLLYKFIESFNMPSFIKSLGSCVKPGGTKIKAEWWESPEYYKRCHDSETLHSLPMPIFIGSVGRVNHGFFSLYDDLSVVSQFLGFSSRSHDYEEATIEGFIEDLSKLEGKVYFSYHDEYLGQVINALCTPCYGLCYLHFFHIREPIPNSNVKVCEGFSFQHVGF